MADKILAKLTIPAADGRRKPRRPRNRPVLADIPGNQEQEFVEDIKVRDLRGRSKYKPVNDLDEPRLAQPTDGAPECRLASAWITAEKIGFRINFTIISRKPKKTKDDFTLSGGDAELIIKAISDYVKKLVKLPGGQDSASR